MKLIKLLIGATAVLPTTIIPVTAMTSCARSWGNLSAFSIGGVINDESPYANIESDELDYDAVPYANYLQSNYSIKQSTNTAYAYSSPMKWNKTDKKWELGKSGWYTYGSSTFKSTASYKDDDDRTQTSSNARNATLSSNISFINTIGLTINNFVSNALKYQSSQIRAKDKSQQPNVKAAWGEAATNKFTLNFGDRFSQQIQDFIESSYANANLNGSGKATAMLRTSNVTFAFVDGTNPLPTYKFTNPSDKETRNGFTDAFFQYLEGTTAPVVGYAIDDFQHYSSKSKIQKEGEADEHYTLQYKNVPIRVKLSSLSQSYLNPTKSSPFLVNDYYSSDKQVKSTIGNQWKETMPDVTGGGKEKAIPHWKTFKWNTNQTPVNFATTGEKYDTRLTQADGNDFIILINYTVNVYTKDNAKKKDSAAISQLSNIFPACWLDIFKNRTDWYKVAHKESDLYTINSNTVSKVASHFNQLLKSNNGKAAKDLSQTDKNYLSFLGYIFANSSKTVDSNDALQPTNEIQ